MSREGEGLLFGPYDIGLTADDLGRRLERNIYELGVRVSPLDPFAQQTMIEPESLSDHERTMALLSQSLRLPVRGLISGGDAHVRPALNPESFEYARRDVLAKQRRRLGSGALLLAMREEYSSVPDRERSAQNVRFQGIGVVAVLGKHGSPRRLMVYPKGGNGYMPPPSLIKGVPFGPETLRYHMRDEGHVSAAEWAVGFTDELLGAIDE